jgi:hypothetical protein
MSPKRFRLLIVGCALTVFGPAFGILLYMAGVLLTARAAFATPPASLDVGTTFFRLILSSVPAFVGACSGLVGMCLSAYLVLAHLFGPEEQPSPTPAPEMSPPPAPPRSRGSAPTPPLFPKPALVQDDTRYMPKDLGFHPKS